MLIFGCAENQSPVEPENPNDIINQPPSITSLLANPTSIKKGDSTVITAEVDNEENEQLQFAWESDFGFFTESDSEATITWIAPEDTGIFSVKLVVSDSTNSVEDSVNIFVEVDTLHLIGSLSGLLLDSTYIVDGDIIVEQGDSLIIEPGAELLFTGYYSLTIDGYLNASGLSTDSITFKSYGNCDNWGGIYFTLDSDSSSHLEYCIVMEAFSGVTCISSVSLLRSSFINNEEEGVKFCSSNPSIEYCTISGNSSNNESGGIHIYNSSPRIFGCVISNNYAEEGGGIYCTGSNGSIENCTINGNSSEHDGAGIYLKDSSPSIQNCIFLDNSIIEFATGGGIACDNNSCPQILNCSFNNNHASRGGGIGCDGHSHPSIEDCYFQDNYGGYGGGISFKSSSSASIINCNINNNSSYIGGGIYNDGGGESYVEKCIINYNSADINGGGINIEGGSDNSFLFTDCEIIGNTCEEKGGGIYCQQMNFTIERCVIANNSAGISGGGLQFRFSDNISINNCTIAGNYSGSSDCINTFVNDIISISNTIISDNSGGLFYENVDLTVITHCDFYNNSQNFLDVNIAGIGEFITFNANGDSCDVYQNIYLNPNYVSPIDNNWNLQGNSPCIDAGLPSSSLDPDGTIADIGAFYYGQ